jgi:SAM-dependent methyltransferase
MKSTTDLVKEKYGDTALSGLSSQHAGVHAVAEAFGYSAEELASIPAEANMGLSCGNPLATAHLKEGEVVVDLGSGGGLDVFLAARQVGSTGKAIGIDMTPQMLELARANASKGGYRNVEFLEGQIDAIPLPDESANVVISNCVVNLAPDKRKVFQEIYRVLKRGGRVAISDIALKQELPGELAQSAAALVGCIAGAISIKDYEDGLKAAGFTQVAIIDSGADLMAYAQVEGAAGCCSPAPAAEASSCCSPAPAAQASSCCSPAPAASSSECCSPAPAGSQAGCAPSSSSDCCSPEASPKPIHEELGELLRRYDVNAYAASVKVFAIK